MAYQKTETIGYGSRVKQSFKKIATGFTLFLTATVMLWWNEGDSVKTRDMLKEAQAVCVEMPNPSTKDANLEGQLVCGSAVTSTTDSLIDNDFGIGVKAISMKRTAEYYQWHEIKKEETKEKRGGGMKKTYSYEYNKAWGKKPVNSSKFEYTSGHKNVVLAIIEDSVQWAEHVSFGAYNLSSNLIHSISSFEPLKLDLSDNLMRQLDKTTQAAYERYYTPKDLNSNDYNFVHVSDNQLYLGPDQTSPTIGDVRVKFEKVPSVHEVTVVAVVDGDSFKPFKAKNGYTLEKLVMGKKDMDQFFEDEQTANTLKTWMVRILGIMMVIGAFKLIFGFVETLLKFIPFVSNIIGWGVGVICTVLGFVWSLTVIALAWLFYRPTLGFTLLAISALLIWIFALGGKSKLKQIGQK
ncbi:MAG: TMEM43 family protein [Prevotella sp.]|nr:TMEM43 family protein [Prevotella sp.]